MRPHKAAASRARAKLVREVRPQSHALTPQVVVVSHMDAEQESGPLQLGGQHRSQSIALNEHGTGRALSGGRARAAEWWWPARISLIIGRVRDLRVARFGAPSPRRAPTTDSRSLLHPARERARSRRGCRASSFTGRGRDGRLTSGRRCERASLCAIVVFALTMTTAEEASSSQGP